MISYRKGMILERLSRVLPREGIIDVEFVPSSRKIKKKKKAKDKSLSEDEKSYLSSVLNDMEDDEIKERLLSMGQSFLNKDK